MKLDKRLEQELATYIKLFGVQEQSINQKRFIRTLKASQRLSQLAPNIITSITIDPRGLTINTTDNIQLLTLLRDHSVFLYETLIDVTALDYPNKRQRFKVVYLLTSLIFNHRLTVAVYVDEFTSVNSATVCYYSAN